MVGALAALAGPACGDAADVGAPVALGPAARDEPAGPGEPADPGGAANPGEPAGPGGADATKKTIQVCEAPQLKAYANVITPEGLGAGFNSVEVKGVVVAVGADSPPSSECHEGQSWVKIKETGTNDEWLGCFFAPRLQLGLAAGDPVELSHRADLFAFTASMHDTLRKAGALVAHVEWTAVEDDVALPDGITIARGFDEVCRLPDNPCKPRSYGATFESNGTLLSLKPGEEGRLGAYRVFLDRYWLESVSSACDGGGANIVVAITPNVSP